MIKKILLADEDHEALEQLQSKLESLGITVYSAENTADALTLFKKHKPDAVAIDLMMEQADSGFIIAYNIKKEAAGREVPVAVLTSATYHTGIRFDVTTPEAKEWLKCDFILEKPVRAADLIKHFEQYYEQAEVPG